MKPTEVAITRKFNMGNYESFDVNIKASLNENENVVNALHELEQMVMDFWLSRPAAKIAAELGRK